MGTLGPENACYHDAQLNFPRVDFKLSGYYSNKDSTNNPKGYVRLPRQEGEVIWGEVGRPRAYEDPIRKISVRRRREPMTALEELLSSLNEKGPSFTKGVRQLQAK